MVLQSKVIHYGCCKHVRPCGGVDCVWMKREAIQWYQDRWRKIIYNTSHRHNVNWKKMYDENLGNVQHLLTLLLTEHTHHSHSTAGKHRAASSAGNASKKAKTGANKSHVPKPVIPSLPPVSTHHTKGIALSDMASFDDPFAHLGSSSALSFSASTGTASAPVTGGNGGGGGGISKVSSNAALSNSAAWIDGSNSAQVSHPRNASNANLASLSQDSRASDGMSPVLIGLHISRHVLRSLLCTCFAAGSAGPSLAASMSTTALSTLDSTNMLSSLANSASSINFIDQQQQAAAAASQDGQPPIDGEAAARRKLESMERTVNLDSNFDLLNE
jgi:hypothetical protein